MKPEKLIEYGLAAALITAGACALVLADAPSWCGLFVGVAAAIVSRPAAEAIASRFFDLSPVILAAILATFGPFESPEEQQRAANVAVATERAVDDQIARGWHGSKWELVSATLTAIRFESGPRMSLAVHEGSNNRNGWCLGQIHHTNGLWKDYAESLEELVGTDVDSTYRCLRTVTRTLAHARGYCAKWHYRTNWRTAMWSIYGTGHKCWISPTAAKRSRFQRGLESKTFVPDERMVQLVEATRAGA